MAKTGKLIGPYARQVTGSKLKFWFAFECDGLTRYELSIDAGDRRFATRRRQTYPGKPPVHASNFSAYALPEDLSPYPCVPFERRPGHNLASAAVSLLRGKDVADATRVRLVGILPTTDD